MSEQVFHVQMKRVCKAYEQANTRIEVLRDLNLEVKKGASLAIMGQSGSGKSTLLSLLAGLDLPDSGQVWIAGQEISAMNEKALSVFRARSLGIIFQQFHLLSNLTALENIGLPLELAKDPDHLAKAQQVLAEVGLAHRAHHHPGQLSGGEKQRVAIARALVVNPALLLADEPSGSLDTKTGHAIMDLLFNLSSQHHSTLILVTHSELLAKRCDSSLRLEQGSLQ